LDENILRIYNMCVNAIVFDLDETIGYFTQLNCIWESLQKVSVSQHPQVLFNNVMDIFDDYMRPLMFNILGYVKQKKQEIDNVNVMIYTNNNGPKQWTLMIKSYIEYKLNYELFDNIICAFKIDGKVIEPCRTTYQKTFNDLVRCASLPKSTKVFFLDDHFHEKMNHDNIYYIKIRPYVFQYPYDVILDKIKHNTIIQYFKTNYDIDETTFNRRFEEAYSPYISHFNHRSDTDLHYKIDTIVSKRVLRHLKYFFSNIIKHTTPSKKKTFRLKKSMDKRHRQTLKND